MTGTVTGSVEQAYRVCEAITREQARNFHYGIRLLRPDRRAALCAVYALARRIDDIGDGDRPAPEKLAALAGVRHAVARRWAPEEPDLIAPAPAPDPALEPVLVALDDAARRLPIPVRAFAELIDGVEMDVRGRRYRSFAELVGYCRCVAGSVGRMCLGVFGTRRGAHPDAPAYADALGIALQQTNILRDIREDLLLGRVYLPAEDLERFGVRLAVGPDGRLVDPDGRLAALIRFSAERARRWYADGLRLAPLLDRRSAACCTAMSGIYAALLERIAEDPTRTYDRRLSLPAWRKAGVAGRALAGGVR